MELDSTDRTDSDEQNSILDEATSPSQGNINRSPSLSTKAKTRIDTTTGNGGRCLLSNYDKETGFGIEYVHLLGHDSDNLLLSKLEYSWGLQWGTLNVGTRLNVMKLKSDLHVNFEGSLFTFVLEESVLTQCEDPDYKPDFRKSIKEKTKYKYLLLPTQSMQAAPITRIVNTDRLIVKEEDVKIHVYPFLNFYVESHVHPLYMICRAGTFTGLCDIDIECDREAFKRLQRMVKIYKAWMRTTPLEDRRFTSQHATPPGDDVGLSDDGSRTIQHRSNTRAYARALEKVINPGLYSSKRRRPNESGSLTYRTVKDVKVLAREERIRDWVSSVDTAVDPHVM